MNILEIAKSIGAEDQGAGLVGGSFIGAIRLDWLERFALAVRSNTPEPAEPVEQ